MINKFNKNSGKMQNLKDVHIHILVFAELKAGSILRNIM